MAIVRTVLPNGAIQPQHGSLGYEQDMDSNMELLDEVVGASGANVAGDLGLNGVYSGFTLSNSASLTPGLAAGVLYAQGLRFSLATPAPGPAPASATNYLFYNSASGFYYQTSAVAATAGDALIGQVTTSGTAVTAVTQGTALFGGVSVTASAAGNITVPHVLGRTPKTAIIQMTSLGQIAFQSGTLSDATNLYLQASAAGVTAKVILL